MSTYPLYKDDHVQEAKSFLPAQFKDSSNFNDLLDVIIQQVQEIENLFRDIFLCKLLGDATDQQLEDYGAIAGEPRNGLSDAAYRNRIKGRIIANRSSGQVDTILDYIAVQGECLVLNATEFPAHIYIYIVNNFTFDDSFYLTLKKMVSAGVRLEVGHVVAENTPFVFRSVFGSPPSYGDGFSLGGSDGGYFATLLEE